MIKVDLLQHHHIHFIGIGGISMSGLAEILSTRGYTITGSDVSESDTIKHLRAKGIHVAIPHDAKNITRDIDLVVYTAAIKPHNPEMIAAGEMGIDIIDRACLLGSMMSEYDAPICVSGTHGKTTTTAMIAEALISAGQNPTVTAGGVIPSISSSFRLGGNGFFVVEACEYFNSFHKFFPKAGVILNIEADHLDFFKGIEDIERSFHQFAMNISSDGILVINGSIQRLNKITDGLRCRVVTFGGEGCLWRYGDVSYNEAGCPAFTILRGGRAITRLQLGVIGHHNVLNALAAFAVCYELGANPAGVAQGLSAFTGAKRRYEMKGVRGGVTIVDDYAHHPTEIMTTLAGAKRVKRGKLYCVFQPHTYTRTYNLLNEFAEAFDDADEIIVLDVYPAREPDTGLVHSRDLVDRINRKRQKAIYFPSFETAKNYLLKNCIPNDLLITMGAGDVYLVGEAVLSTELSTLSTDC